MKRRFLPALLSGLLLTLGLAQGDGENAQLLFRVGTYHQIFENGVPPESLGTYVVVLSTLGAALPAELSLRDPDGEVLLPSPDVPITPYPDSSGLFLGLPEPPKAGAYTLTYMVDGVVQTVTASLELSQVLPAAENLAVRYQDGDLTVSWNAVPGAAAYELAIEESGSERREVVRLDVPSDATRITAPHLTLEPASSYLAVLFAYDFGRNPLDPAALSQPGVQPDVSVTSRIFAPPSAP